MAEQTRHPLRLSPLGFTTDMNLSVSINNGHLANNNINNRKRLEKLAKNSDHESIMRLLENESACQSMRRLSAVNSGASRLPPPKQNFASVRLKHNPEDDVKKAAASMLTSYGQGYQSPDGFGKVKGCNLVESEMNTTIREIVGGQKSFKRESSIFETFAPLNDSQARVVRYKQLAKG